MILMCEANLTTFTTEVSKQRGGFISYFLDMSANSLCRLFWAEDGDIGCLKWHVIRSPLEKKDDAWMAVI
jgi:hypothetical protein